MKYHIEKQVGDISLTKANLFIKNITDMEELEYWEDRLTFFEVPYAIAFTKNSKRIKYHVFTKTSTKMFKG